MPLTKRRIDPVNVSRVKVDKSVRNELECVTNNTLANIIRELSSLSKNAEDMFSELAQEASMVFGRSCQLQQRIDHLRDKVTQLNATAEEVLLTDIHTRKPFKSTVVKEQQVITRSTIPLAILDNYKLCEAPPALDKLNEFREDGKDCMKFYTDSTYFVELWVREMEKEMEEKKSQLNQRRDKKKGRPKQAEERKRPREVADPKAKWKNYKDGVEFSAQPEQQHPQQQGKRMPDGRTMNQHGPDPHHQHARPGTLPVEHSSPAGVHHEHGGSLQRHPQHQQQHPHQQLDPRLHNASNGPYQVDPQANAHPGQQTQHPQGRDQFKYEQYQMSPEHTRPGRSSTAHLASPQSRPSQPPPAPPPPSMMQSPSGRGELPPPPPPPPLDEPAVNSMPPQRQQPMMYNHLDGSPGKGSNSPRNSPARHPSYSSTSSPHRATPDRGEQLPPPIMPPLTQLTDLPPSSHDSMPPPPPSPPPPLEYTQTPSPPPPPPPPPIMTNSQGPPPPPPLPPHIMNGSIHREQVDGESISSTGSTITEVPIKEPQKPSMGQERSALLDEIRRGDCYKRLRVVEEKREKKKKTAAPIGRFDVQALMDRAVEMRRKVIEHSDSDDSDSGSDDGTWDTD